MSDLDLMKFLAAQLPEEIMPANENGEVVFLWRGSNPYVYKWEKVTLREWPYVVSLVKEKFGIGTLGHPLNDKFELALAEICYQEGIRRSCINATWQQDTDALMEVLK